MRWETKATYSMCLCKKYLSKHGNREKSYINIDSFWWNKNFKRSVCTVAGYFYGNIGKLIKTHSHNFRKVQTRQLKELTVAPRGHLFPHPRHWDVKPRVTTWQIGMATPLDTKYCGDGFLCSTKGGGSLWCRRAIGYSKVLLQHLQRATELRGWKRTESAPVTPAFRVRAWIYGDAKWKSLSNSFFTSHTFLLSSM